MTQSHHAFVDAVYSPRARDYLTSAVHASGADLDQIESRVRGHASARVLDLGSGGGHVTYRAAPHVAEVVAVDLSEQMLATVMSAATERGLRNVTTRQGSAENLPFPDGQFDFVLSRFTAHHWHDLDAGLREARRVLAPGGVAIFIDSVAPPVPLLDSHLQTLELLRDASHVRNYTVPEWVAALARCGFHLDSFTARRLRIEFDSWIARTRTCSLHGEALRSLQRNAPDEVRARLGIETDGSFQLDAATFELSGSPKA